MPENTIIMYQQAKSEAEASRAGASSPFSYISRVTSISNSLLDDPPLGEGWDENGNDLSKVANDVSVGRNCRLLLLVSLLHLFSTTAGVVAVLLLAVCVLIVLL